MISMSHKPIEGRINEYIDMISLEASSTIYEAVAKKHRGSRREKVTIMRRSLRGFYYATLHTYVKHIDCVRASSHRHHRRRVARSILIVPAFTLADAHASSRICARRLRAEWCNDINRRTKPREGSRPIAPRFSRSSREFRCPVEFLRGTPPGCKARLLLADIFAVCLLSAFVASATSRSRPRQAQIRRASSRDVCTNN